MPYKNAVFSQKKTVFSEGISFHIWPFVFLQGFSKQVCTLAKIIDSKFQYSLIYLDMEWIAHCKSDLQQLNFGTFSEKYSMIPEQKTVCTQWYLLKCIQPAVFTMQPSNNPTFELLEKVYSYLMADLKEDLFNAWLYSCVNKLNTMGCNIISILTNSCLPFNKSEKAGRKAIF